MRHLGGAVGRVAATDPAYALRDQELIVDVIARTPGANGFDEAIELKNRHDPTDLFRLNQNITPTE